MQQLNVFISTFDRSFKNKHYPDSYLSGSNILPIWKCFNVSWLMRHLNHSKYSKYRLPDHQLPSIKIKMNHPGCHPLSPHGDHFSHYTFCVQNFRLCSKDAKYAPVGESNWCSPYRRIWPSNKLSVPILTQRSGYIGSSGLAPDNSIPQFFNRESSSADDGGTERCCYSASESSAN
jgi:hypothetical protein